MLVDLRHLLRSLRRSPASAVAAVVTLSLTLGAGASILAVVDAVLLTPPPFNDPDALFRLGEVLPGDDASASRSVRYDTVEAWRERVGTLARIEAADGTHLTLTEPGPADSVHVTDVTPGYLPLLGAATAHGRMFESGDLSQPVVILTHTMAHEVCSRSHRRRPADRAQRPPVYGRRRIAGTFRLCPRRG